MSDDEGEEEADSAEQVPEAGKDVSLIIGLLEEEDDNKKYAIQFGSTSIHLRGSSTKQAHMHTSSTLRTQPM